MKRVIVFDFDGTLVLSNEIKRIAFDDIASEFENGLLLMAEIMQEPPGDRTAVIQEFATRVGAEQHADALVQRYSDICRDKVATCPERAGASDFLHDARASGWALFVNSATPTGPLREIISLRYDSTVFQGVYGGHGQKVENLSLISRLSGCRPADMWMVGDGVDDHDAAREFGCRFFGLDDGSLAREHPTQSWQVDLSGLRQAIMSS